MHYFLGEDVVTSLRQSGFMRQLTTSLPRKLIVLLWSCSNLVPRLSVPGNKTRPIVGQSSSALVKFLNLGLQQTMQKFAKLCKFFVGSACAAHIPLLPT